MLISPLMEQRSVEPLEEKKRRAGVVSREVILGISICDDPLGTWMSETKRSAYNNGELTNYGCSTINFGKDLPLAQGIKFE